MARTYAAARTAPRIRRSQEDRGDARLLRQIRAQEIDRATRAKLRRRYGKHWFTALNRSEPLARDGGQALFEVVLALCLMGVIAGIALPSFAWLAIRSHQTLARAEVRAALPAVERYRSEHGGSYAGMTLAELQAYDVSVDVGVYVAVDGSTFCLEHVAGPVAFHREATGLIEEGRC